MVVGAELCVSGRGAPRALACARDRAEVHLVRELLRAPFYHPCLEEAVRSALRELVKDGSGGVPFELEEA